MVAAGLDTFVDLGFEAATLEHIALRVGMRLATVRERVESKEAIVRAFHLERLVQLEVLGASTAGMPMPGRLSYVFHQQVGGIARHRRWLVEIAQRFIDPSDELSVFGGNHLDLIARGCDVFRRILAGTLADDEREGAANALRMLLMAFLLIFMYDDEPGTTTHRLIDDLFVELVPQLSWLATSDGRMTLLEQPTGKRLIELVVRSFGQAGISGLPQA